MDLQIKQLKPSQIERSPHNPRIFREKDPDLAGLAASIKSKGVLEPILVRPFWPSGGYLRTWGSLLGICACCAMLLELRSE
jgi:hypothetical protein